MFRICILAAVLMLASAGNALQDAVNHAMFGKQGSAVVMRVGSGEILASYRIDVAARRLASPGSTVKPFTLLALMDAGLVTETTAVFCPHTVRVNERVLDCSHAEGLGAIDATRALAHSCNHFFVSLSKRLPIDSLYRSFSQAGFGAPTGKWRSEVSGSIQQPDSTEAMQLMAIGERNIAVTPLALAESYRRLALHLHEHPIIAKGLEAAVTTGTARAAANRKMRVAGKTGTSGGHAWFAGFAPAERPDIVLVVFLEAGSGGSDAAPVAGRIFEGYR
jgi:cell division protein FtsI/penicillin-binding protein 2